MEEVSESAPPFSEIVAARLLADPNLVQRRLDQDLVAIATLGRTGGEGWYAACLYRSALENLFEGYLGGATFSVMDAEKIDGIDEELRRNLPRAQGVTSAAIPEGIPEHHWWWTLPTG